MPLEIVKSPMRDTVIDAVNECSGFAQPELITGDETSLIDDLNYDSISRIELAFELEDRLGLKFDLVDPIADCKTVGDVLRIVRERAAS